MATTMDLSTHRAWEDYLSILLGLLMIVSPFMSTGINTSTEPTIVLNAVVVGGLVCIVGLLELAWLDRWEEWLGLALGAWMAYAPWALGYTQHSGLTLTHVVLGGLMIILSLLEIWQDRNRAFTS
ncbi:MAG: hypothetical protein EPO23_08915 [Xanthobacteraceae bacterium]|nr:MAG: hypothetical protein EPO23_08915 [Xanthobacteraceae bacterium]